MSRPDPAGTAQVGSVPRQTHANPLTAALPHGRDADGRQAGAPGMRQPSPSRTT
ncbi:hypothetical protein EV385_6615 [Krasilnikovia cinnamomea]|uniref:Uncharacterized protein n=1 Tax=Krasilnikovia cinnamomea TaxID=349313 RepID=A0A4Q7Z915_9ACTN|nr:hypothetical protein [Krasilnikovia cinnamomea]RZU46541.1 hypothetical protein EV385_6615 [Krasilnikovia cinnamomea]